ncbi:MAG TPA: SurA N-terminal domain-containing protein [Candidatus Saccharimonadales bacterium]|nr:SurA N-terminal domain-containing protein [Candidatus Saccharimonadales bacterium]
MAARKSKKSVRKPSRVSSTVPSQRKSLVSSETLSQVKKPYAIALIVIAILFVLYLLRSWFVAAIVNGQPITRLSLINEMEKSAGKQTMSMLVTKTLIEQEAQKRHITVSDAQVNAEVKKISDSLSAQGQTLDQALAAQGLSRADFPQQVRLQLLAQKLVGNVTVSDKEVDDYIAQNKDSFPQDAKEEDIKAQAKLQLQQQKAQTALQSLLQKLQKDAKITYFVNL